MKTLAKRMAGCAALAALAIATPAFAQLGGLPGVVPTLPTSPLTDRLPLEGVRDLTGRVVDRALQAPSRLDGLIRRSRGALEADPQGWPVVTAEILVVDLTAEARERALAAGYTVVREEPLEALGLTTTVLAPPRRMLLPRAVERLQELAPDADIAFNHVYAPAGEMGAALAPSPAVSTLQATNARLGLIDTGIDVTHPAFAASGVSQRGFAGTARVGAHGTAVASLMVGRSGGFSGGAPGADILVADIYGGDPAGGASTAVAQALDWMAAQRVAVVNISLVGPRNRLVERAVAGAQARGVTLVAAVGNDGPAAPPLFPAAYDGVIGVTAVSARDQVLPEAARGGQVDFAAPGADMAAAGASGGWTSVRGASFAAPIVAGLLSRQGVAALTRSATDLGAPGRDPVYGAGLVGAQSRVAPRQMGARGRLSR
ncbi:S8 family serine peptidase [Brevundimonas staleyi]|uniref:S8 family serine peptidase n=1 Tax=Brevundimonas staleyi TaxID=74326 RepID=A0ABW0FTL8_9CAUL